MAEEKKATSKSVSAVKEAKTTKKATTRKKYSKDQSLECEVCGMAVIVDQVGDEVVEEDSALLCCGKPMKARATAKKAAKK